MTQKLEADICIIGSGAGGAVMAYSLSQAGFSVVVLEAGPRFDPSQYPLSHTDWERQPKAFSSSVDTRRDRYTVGPPEPLHPQYRHLQSWADGQKASVEKTHRAPPKVHRVKGVGGCTLHYQGEAHRFSPHGFRSQSLFGYGEDWPIHYEDLAPYYEKMEKLLGVAGDANNPFKAARPPFPNPPHALSCASHRVKQGFDKLGLHLHPNSLAILSRPYDDRVPCNYCNGCSQGCMVGAKSSMDVSLLPKAEATGNTRIFPHSAAANIQVDGKGKATGVTFFDENKQENFVHAKVVVLSAGAMESPRLLLNSQSNAFPDGLVNRSGVVGRYFMETVIHSLTALFEEPIHSYKGLQIDARCWDFNRPDPQQPFQAGVVFGVSAFRLIGPGAYTKYLLRGWGKRHKDQMREYFGNVLYLFAVGEHLPHQDNRVLLDPTVRDSFGIPVAQISTKLSNNELEMLSFMSKQGNAILGAAGAKKIIGEFSAYDQSSITQMSGTCRMGVDPQRSVVNGFCQSHDVPNVFIVDASCFVTEGGGDSPSLTIQAIALRAGDYLAEEVRKGNM